MTIAEGGTQKYALDDAADRCISFYCGDNESRTGSDRYEGGCYQEPDRKSCKGNEFTNVSVFDAATMTEAYGEERSRYTTGTGKRCSRAYQSGRKNIAGNVRRVLELMYGQGKVAVS